MLGSGSFGQVVEVAVEGESKRYAIKIIKNRELHFRMAQTEIKILQTIKKCDPDDTKNIGLRYLIKVRIVGSFIHCNHMCIVYELLSQNLYELLHATQFKGISLRLVREFAHQILTSLSFLNELGVVHCDIKPEKWGSSNQLVFC